MDFALPAALRAQVAGSADSLVIQGRSIPPTFGDTGHLRGTDGCNTIDGADLASATILWIPSFAVTDMYCPDSTDPRLDYRVQRALLSARYWAIRDSLLVISDSTGNERLRYGRRIAPEP